MRDGSFAIGRAWLGVILMAPAAALGQSGTTDGAAVDEAPFGLDAHGDTPLATVGRLGHGAFLMPSLSGESSGWSLSFHGEWARQPLIAYRLSSAEPDTVSVEPVFNSVSTLNLRGAYAPTSRVAIGLAVPFHYAQTADEAVTSSGYVPGDLRFSVPVGILVPASSSERGVGLTIAPWFGLPLTDGASRLGIGKLHGGVRLAGELQLGKSWLLLNAGVRLMGQASELTPVWDQSFGAWNTFLGAGLGTQVGPLHIGAEGRAWTIGSGSDAAPTAVFPAEVLGTVGYSFGKRALLSTGGGSAVTAGAGAGLPRAHFGLTLQSAQEKELVVDEPREEEPTGGWLLKVRNAEGNPVPGALVQAGDEIVGRCDGAGEWVIADDLAWSKGVRVVANAYEPAEVVEPDGEEGRVDVVLPWKAVVLNPRVTNEAGELLDAFLVVTSGDGNVQRGKAGELELLPGVYEVETMMDSMGTQSRRLVIPDQGAGSFDVILQESRGAGTLSVNLTNAEGIAVSGARVLVGGRPIGTTGNGGRLEATGFEEGPVEVEIRHPDFTTSFLTLDLAESAAVQEVVLDRVPGSVRVRVTDAQGLPVTTAVARFSGPSRLAAMPLGDNGSRQQFLSPGTWALTITSSEHAAQQREIVVPEDSYELIDIEVILRDSEQGSSDLTLRVVDSDGVPVGGVSVELDGESYGTTSTGGMMQLTALSTGLRRLTLRREGLQETPAVDLVLLEGAQEEIVPVLWETGRVEVEVRSPSGPVRDSVIRFLGDGDKPATKRLVDGTGNFTLGAGEWTVVVTSSEFGSQSRQLDIPVAYDKITRISFVLQPVEGGLGELVVSVRGPNGEPVDGASVSLDGMDLGRTTNLGMVNLEQLTLGLRTLVIEHPVFAEATQDIRLMEGENTVEVDLDWGPGLVNINVTSDGTPVQDAIVRVLGPTRIPAMPVDGQGKVQTVMSAGTWQVLVTSPTHLMSQREVVIREDSEPLTLDVNLLDGDTEQTQLLLRVLDSDGMPIEGVQLTSDGASLGATNSGGSLLLDTLLPGFVTVQAQSRFYESASVEVDLMPGSQERIITMGFVPARVKVTVQDPDGAPVDARIRWVGPGDEDAQQTGADGKLTSTLRPGKWTAIATAVGLGPGRVDLDLKPGDTDVPVSIELERARVSVVEVEQSEAIVAGRAPQEVVRLDEKVLFAFNASAIQPSAGPALGQVANTLLSRPELIRVEVQGHTDDVGGIAYNQALSEERAQAVVDVLVSFGVPRETLVARGYGNQRPLKSNATEEGKAMNRRVEFRLLESTDDKR